ncbi:hypothetical protein PHMEG_00040936, partial [Phytophthora megakarya]
GILAWCGARDEPLLRAAAAGQNGFQVSVTKRNQYNDHGAAAGKQMHSRIRAHKILQCIGLLLARMMCPHIRRLSDHWATTSVGAILAGTFGRFMKRERFERIIRNLHFSDNDAARAQTDKAWKVRPIVDTLQRTFLSGYTPPPVISFDEAMVPSRSRYNPMRQFMKDKPHRWGTKLFIAVCILPKRRRYFVLKSQVVHAEYDACISGGYGAHTDIMSVSVCHMLDVMLVWIGSVLWKKRPRYI